MEDDRDPRARPTLDEAIAGWRVWNLAERGEELRLLPAGSGVDVWEPRRAVEARCGVPASCSPGSAAMPRPTSGAGVASTRAAPSECSNGPVPRGRPPRSSGRSRSGGRWSSTSVGGEGVRVPFPTPAGVLDVCVVRARHRDPARSFTPSTRRLYTLCVAHRGGIQVPDGRRTRPTGIDPERSKPGSSTRTRSTSCPRNPCVGCSGNRDRPVAVPAVDPRRSGRGRRPRRRRHTRRGMAQHPRCVGPAAALTTLRRPPR